MRPEFGPDYLEKKKFLKRVVDLDGGDGCKL
jgi:hypothetical protein